MAKSLVLLVATFIHEVLFVFLVCFAVKIVFLIFIGFAFSAALDKLCFQIIAGDGCIVRLLSNATDRTTPQEQEAFGAVERASRVLYE